jgi:hypothetical protein
VAAGRALGASAGCDLWKHPNLTRIGIGLGDIDPRAVMSSAGSLAISSEIKDAGKDMRFTSFYGLFG